MTDEQAVLAQAAREADNIQRRWVESVKDKTVDAAAREVHAEQRGEALLVWIDTNGELRMQRICRATSLVRPYIPDYLTRRGSL